MKLDKLNNWLTLVANIAVVVGIVALILELNHASRLAEASAYQARMTEIQEAHVQLALSADLAWIFEKFDSGGVETLTPVELRRVRAWHYAIMRRMQSQYFQYKQGFLDRSSIDEALNDIANGIYDIWVDLGLLELIRIPEWKEEIEKRVSKN